MAFTMFQAWHLPKVEVDSIAVRPIGNGLTEVTAIVANRRIVPTHTAQDLQNRISPPDLVSLAGGTVISGYRIINDRTGESLEQERNPALLELRNIAGNGVERLKWIVRGNGPFTVTITSQKGGSHSKRDR
jgi:hypothetical protein